MPIEFSCPNCHKFLRVGDAATGSPVRCPECQHISLAPAPSFGSRGDHDSSLAPPQSAPDGPLPDAGSTHSMNPYAAPTAENRLGTAIDSAEMARSKVGPPALAMMILASVGLLFGIFNAVVMIGFQDQVAPAQPGNEAQQMGERVGQAIGACIGPLFHAIVLIGAFNMRKLQNYGLAMTASILMMLPCSLCCVLGLPFGIWSIVVLNDAGVRHQFRLARDPRR